MAVAVSAAELAPREATEAAAMVLALEVMAAAAMEVDMVLLPVDMVAGTAVDMEALLLAAMAVRYIITVLKLCSKVFLYLKVPIEH